MGMFDVAGGDGDWAAEAGAGRAQADGEHTHEALYRPRAHRRSNDRARGQQQPDATAGERGPTGERGGQVRSRNLMQAVCHCSKSMGATSPLER